VAAGEAVVVVAGPVGVAEPVAVAEPVVAVGPVVVAEPVVAAGAVLAVLGAAAEDLVVEVALPGVPAERLELGPLGQQGLPAEWAAAVGQQPEAALPLGRAARGPRA
jgi:hypothetical protein